VGGGLTGVADPWPGPGDSVDWRRGLASPRPLDPVAMARGPHLDPARAATLAPEYGEGSRALAAGQPVLPTPGPSRRRWGGGSSGCHLPLFPIFFLKVF